MTEWKMNPAQQDKHFLLGRIFIGEKIEGNDGVLEFVRS